MKTRVAAQGAWKLERVAGAAKGGRRAGPGGAAPPIPAAFLRKGVTVDGEFRAAVAAPAVRRLGVVPPLDVSVDLAPGERAVLAVRHPSGALTFHAPTALTASRSARAPASARFQIAVRGQRTGAPGRRGLLSSVLHAIVLKVREALFDELIDAGVRLIAPAVEGAWWRARGLQEGWHEVTAAGLKSGGLPRANMADLAGGRALLLLHGTFSHAAASFAALAGAPGAFFASAGELYGGRIFAFNHFSLSKSPEDNARDLLAALPNRPLTFDVVTHSRGGLVLRSLVEQRDRLGAPAARFYLGHAVLAACPNAGTPLATPARWEQTLGLIANLLEVVPDNPWTTAAELVADGIVSLASHAVVSLPGLAAMDAEGDAVASLQQPPGPSRTAYSALAANFEPDAALGQRLLDAGADAFFGGANDLVVPSEGSWQVDAPAAPAIPAERIGCFGPGGNLAAAEEGTVHHLNLFGQESTVRFLLNGLRATPHAVSPLDPDTVLPTRRRARGAGAVRPRALPAPAAAGIPAVRAPVAPAAREAAPPARGPSDDRLHILIHHAVNQPDQRQILATYRGARVLEPFRTKNPEQLDKDERELLQDCGLDVDLPGSRYSRIIRVHQSIRLCLEGQVLDRKGRRRNLPDRKEMEQFGADLFAALIGGNVRRLYDCAVSEQRDVPLNVVLASTVPWLAALPWEFAFDPIRQKFLATEETHFVRNVITTVPAQQTAAKPGALRILAVSATPMGLAGLSVDEEVAELRESFRTVTDPGLAAIDVLPRATPKRLQDMIQVGAYDVVHFIGHGVFDQRASEGILVFEDENRQRHLVDAASLKALLCRRGIRLVFLNACESARDETKASNRGVAQSLIEGGIPAVVANQYTVLDGAAVKFASRFYWSLAQGQTLAQATREARIALTYRVGRESIDWAIPVVFAQDPNLRLCTGLAG